MAINGPVTIRIRTPERWGWTRYGGERLRYVGIGEIAAVIHDDTYIEIVSVARRAGSDRISAMPKVVDLSIRGERCSDAMVRHIASRVIHELDIPACPNRCHLACGRVAIDRQGEKFLPCGHVLPASTHVTITWSDSWLYLDHVIRWDTNGGLICWESGVVLLPGGIMVPCDMERMIRPQDRLGAVE